jgi:hypothetical protein
VPAQRLHDVGVGVCQFDQQLEQLRQRGAVAAIFHRHAHRAEAHFLEPLDGIYAQLPVVFALQGGVADPLENGAVFLRQGFVLGTEEGGGVRLGHVKPPSNWGKVAMGEPATGISR